jgi:hypothetical protein
MVPGIAKENVFPLAAVEEAGRRQEADPQTMPLAALAEVVVRIEGEEIFLTVGPRTYRVLGLRKNTSLGAMTVNVRVSGNNVRGEYCYHGDKFDMEVARHRMTFIKQAAHELGAKEETIQREVGKVWLALGDLHRKQINALLEKDNLPEEATMTAEEQAAALELLRDPRLLERVLADFEKCGIVGEETNKRVSYLAAVSRLLEKPLAIVVQSSSAAGKSSLMDAVLDFMPEEQREEYSAMTGQALFYMGEKDLKHKIIAVVEEEGASRAAYPLKLLQSEGKLNIASTSKDPVSGKQVTHEYRVEGPVMVFLTTTSPDVDEELLNRCVVLTVNEDRAQTQAIHRKQRQAQTIEGLQARRQRAKIVRLHRNAQRLLRPIEVVNPHVQDLEFPDYMTRTRRDHMKLLTLMQAIALLHQHQREIKTVTCDDGPQEYIEVTAEDVKLARELAGQVLAPSLDELQAQTRRLLGLIVEMVKKECERLQIECGEYRFTRRTVREHTRWGDTQLRLHLRRLEELEYLYLRYGGGQGQRAVYQLRATVEVSDKPADATTTQNFAGVNGHFAGVKENFAGASRALRGGPKNESSPTNAITSRETSRNLDNIDTGIEPEQPEQNRIVAKPVVAETKPNGKVRGAGAGAK